MRAKDELEINKYGQDLITIEQLNEQFNLFELLQKKVFLNDIVHLIIQSKPLSDDIETAIKESNLKSTFTPCILLRKGVASHHLQKITELPESELDKAFVLLLSLFKIAYKRRYASEKNAPHKWWYWDLSDEAKMKQIVQQIL